MEDRKPMNFDEGISFETGVNFAEGSKPNVKVREFTPKSKGWYIINCPACGEHTIAVFIPFSNGAKWSFNGDFEKPTFSPSINIHYGASDDGEIKERRCHFFVADGKITFCGDCTHKFANQTLDLLDVKQY